MRNAFLLSFFILAFGLTSCSSDDGHVSTADSVTVDGVPFLTSNNSGAKKYNVIEAETGTSLWFQISEKGGSGKTISVSLMHPEGSASGNYALKNDQIAAGIAVIAVMDANGHQIAGGSDNQPTGTFSLIDKGNDRYELTFKDVILDPGMASETHISGICTQAFYAK